MFDLNGLTAVVTGASGGIGSAIAKALADQGAQVALSGTRESALKEVAAILPNDPIILPANLGQKEDVEQLVPRALEKLGKIDILVNNAGITRDGLMMRMKDEDWADVIALNLESVFRLSRAVIRPMMKTRFGRIINISSVVGQTGNAGQANYAAAKAGMIGMSKSLAREVASRGITVNCIAPGFIETKMTEILSEQQKEAAKSQIPAGRFGDIQDIAAAAVYLASKEAGYMTGQTLSVNGGMSML
ncbi:3-oxoacyl-(acyl-carrier-protein) reductase [Zymomonas mobilis subsp. mobilis ZM4 = ATCC 31821]|uniref:3-oxoacyl-[acyl-carrier-protein] reductase n=1 Tax=Zymomonas mobilis subsp. mobilis (strain ATCC 31821 / ZM4 / CP4) TaxID=264203 RepID=Q5NN64_ZYMMO|nr:3-oxoacyl-ACP reductase FabG [Zymomonas mobilis]AAV89846.1 3-oxoacyl-(acyl-carrier-protein) reductase [Zymomonas mobilis subsp. mobilis ZM4 = ATCC 31821]ACV74665.1 3-oxoacyl-(acyl-carrier-protein) reductase [Zymomonas mobilis subsp. mobilis NCIMB 11163]AHB09449.1 3-oxoacyl-(acyl-carrier-protein) reductase [Zymomonas mobilis subsp. mobilis str. CP4 = NRRL B-14023]AHJ69755.1 3-oxoacyl-[acyl-carrier-protein] reductase FabG [Zymomonas mobilis subsp. mobilis NRRL B-12526]AHJ71611.1 short chain d